MWLPLPHSIVNISKNKTNKKKQEPKNAQEQEWEQHQQRINNK